MKTTIELVEKLEALPANDALKYIISEAKNGEYHDYKNKKYSDPKSMLAHALLTLSKHYPDVSQAAMEIRAQVIAGAYCEAPDKKDKEMMSIGIDSDKSLSISQKATMKRKLSLPQTRKERQKVLGKVPF